MIGIKPRWGMYKVIALPIVLSLQHHHLLSFLSIAHQVSTTDNCIYPPHSTQYT